MALQKQSVAISFREGLDTKTDPKQISPGKFLRLENSVFENEGLLQKRNGFKKLTSLPNASSLFTTTFQSNLMAIGTSLYAYSSGASQWVNKGPIESLGVDTLSLLRSNTNQTQADSAIAPNGLICTVFTDSVPVAGVATSFYKYVIADSITGQNIVAPTVIPVASGTVTGSSKVFLIGRYFVIVFTNLITATNHLQYVAIDYTNPTSVTANTDISATYTPATTVNFDGYVVNNNLYLAWNGSDGGGAIRVSYIDQTLTQHTTKIFAGKVATLMSVTSDSSGSTPVIWVSFYNLGSTTGFSIALSQQLDTILTATSIIPSGTVLNLTSVATGNILTFYTEISNNYTYDSAIASHFIRKNTLTLTGTLGTSAILVRSVGLASKAFIINSKKYFLSVYSSSFQPTYFLINETGAVVAKLAYGNASGYFTLGLPSVTINSESVSMPYLVKDLVEPINKTQGVTNAAGVYAQTGVNLVRYTYDLSNVITSEIGQNLNLTGGFLWSYDGYQAVEQGFHLWPDSIECTWSATGGSIVAKPDGATNTNAYFYQVTYEWSDNQGNIFRSAPSIPVGVTTTGALSTGSITVNIPTLRLTYKTANPVKLVVYRWSVAQQTYYQVSSITLPTLNSTTVDSIAFVDTLADSSILGNNIIYTTGGVVENIGPPACIDVSLFKSRLVLIDAEDRNLLWFSKQVIESTPVEMNDLFTIFIAPTIGAQGSTGGMEFSAPMDDKLIIFKKDAIYYITGTGPDNTGTNNDFSEPVFITATVGSSNKKSIVFIPQGLMFQSDKGIWLLGRDLNTSYIGSPVEAFNNFKVLSAINIPGTNQVRFTLSNGVTLMYDYFYNQWGSFSGIPAISSTLFQSLHTYINSTGEVFQENPGSYLDGTNPVLMSFQTGWLNVAGLQGYERIYFFYLLGSYISPHKLSLMIGYDYNPAPCQQVLITPVDNYSAPWGGDSVWGNSPLWGGSSSLEQWRVFTQRQRCQAFQITMNEIFDPFFGTLAGAGLTLSGLNMIVGLKKAYRPIAAKNTAG